MKNRSILASFTNAVSGIAYTIKEEKNMKVHMAASIMVVILSWALELSKIEWLIVCLTIAAVITCELINTAVEVVVDLITVEYHPKAKIAKDVAAGAVLVTSLASIIVGYFLFFDRMRRLFIGLL